VKPRAAPPAAPRPFDVGAIVPLDIERIAAASGDGVGRHASGITVFCEGAVPGERVHVLIDRVQPRWARGTVFSTERPHPRRTTPACSVADVCGGCLFHGLPYDEELAWKAEAVEGSLRRIAPSVAWPAARIIGDRDPNGYRERARMGVAQDGGTGFRAARSHRIVSSPACPVLHPSLDIARQRAAAALEVGEDAELVVEWDAEREGCVLSVEADRLDPASVDALGGLASDPLFLSILYQERGGERTLLVGDGQVHRRFGDVVVRVPAAHFAQANRRLVPQLVAQAIDPLGALDGRHVLELFAGAGTFTFALAARGARVTAIESDRAAVEAGIEAARRAGLSDRVSFFCSDLFGAWDDVLATVPAIDHVVVDPPRAGLTRALADRLAHLGPARLVYVSCDPVTMARDLARMGSTEVEELALIDMFPRTPHMEAVAHVRLSAVRVAAEPTPKPAQRPPSARPRPVRR
jgi:23S rRNA (uracil1939-C5)-methyltransferase